MSGMRSVTYLIEYEIKNGVKIETDLATQLAKVNHSEIFYYYFSHIS